MTVLPVKFQKISAHEHASGTPPTRVDTTSSPAAAASTSAMQKASVRDVFRKTRPRASTPGTCALWPAHLQMNRWGLKPPVCHARREVHGLPASI
jgi:hypothetical protein